MTVMVYSCQVLADGLRFRIGRRRWPLRALGSFSAMPSVSSRERISIHIRRIDAGAMPQRDEVVEQIGAL
jgi:hypothetical protein